MSKTSECSRTPKQIFQQLSAYQQELLMALNATTFTATKDLTFPTKGAHGNAGVALVRKALVEKRALPGHQCGQIPTWTYRLTDFGKLIQAAGQRIATRAANGSILIGATVGHDA